MATKRVNRLNDAIDTHGLEATKKIFSKRLKKELEKKSWSSVRFAEELGREIGNINFRIPTISAWMTASSLPREHYLVSISRVLQVDEAYLLGLQDIPRKLDVVPRKERITRLEQEQLKLYDSEPLWCVPKGNPLTDGFYALVNANDLCLVTSRETIPFEEINFSVYKNLSPYSFAIDSNMKILTINDIQRRKSIWVQGVGGTFSTRELIKGAYAYDKKIKGVVNKSGYTLSLETYGVNWVAYDRKIIEEPPQKII